MPPQNTNSLLVWRGDDAIIVDAWGTAAAWDDLLKKRGLRLCAIYSTHGHPDHISAAPQLAAIYDVPWYLARADWNLLGWGNDLLEYFGLPPIDTNTIVAPKDLPAGQYHVLGDVNMRVIPAPGHSAGGLMYYFPEFGVLAVGDMIFYEGVGRTDLPGGNTDALRGSISALRAMHLPDDTFIVHGHGPASNIKMLNDANPLFR